MWGVPGSTGEADTPVSSDWIVLKLVSALDLSVRKLVPLLRSAAHRAGQRGETLSLGVLTLCSAQSSYHLVADGKDVIEGAFSFLLLMIGLKRSWHGRREEFRGAFESKPVPKVGLFCYHVDKLKRKLHYGR